MCQSVQDGSQSLKSSSIRDQYPRDIIKSAGPKNDVIACDVERNYTRNYNKREMKVLPVHDPLIFNSVASFHFISIVT